MYKLKHYLLFAFVFMNFATSAYALDNDECTGAFDLTNDIGQYIQGTNIGTNSLSMPDMETSCMYNKAGVWYYFDAAQTGDYSIKINNATFNDVLTLFEGDCTNTLTEISCSNQDEFGFTGEYLQVNLEAGETYYIMVSGADCTFGSTEGTFSIKVNIENTPISTPVNEDCDALVGLDFTAIPSCITGSTSGASKANPQPSCSSYAGASVWYKILGPSSGNLQLYADPNFSEILTVYEGQCGSLDELDCSLNNGSTSENMIFNNLEAGETYYIQVSGNFATIESNFLNSNICYITLSTNVACNPADDIGEPCNDFNVNTIDDVWNSACECIGSCPAVDTPCDDGNPNTINDQFNNDCECAGQCTLENTICDDGDLATGNPYDYFDENCNCVGEFITNCPIGEPCNDGNPATGNPYDYFDENCDCIGEPICVENQPCEDGDAATVEETWNVNCECVGSCITAGESCDDCNPNTIYDQWDGDCNCQGICPSSSVGEPCTYENPYITGGELSTDCECMEGSCTEGTSCNDGNQNTDNDALNNECECVGICIEGTSCDDDNAYTTGETLNADCECVSPGDCLQYGLTCDDGDATTENDVWTYWCNCVGTPICLEEITVTASNVADSYFETSDLIKTDDSPGAIVAVSNYGSLELNAKSQIKLYPGFTARDGAIFHGYIDGCESAGTSSTQIVNADSSPPESSDIERSTDTSAEQETLPIPSSLDWVRHYPNPFNDLVTIEFSLPEDAEVSLVVSDINGKQLIRVTEKEAYAGTLQQIKFSTSSWISGIYAYQLIATEHTTGSTYYASGKLVKL